MRDRLLHGADIFRLEKVTHGTVVNPQDSMLDFERIEAVLGEEHCDQVWIHILQLENGGVTDGVDPSGLVRIRRRKDVDR